MNRAEAKVHADAYLSARQGVPCTVFEQDGWEARTHWRFYWNTVAAIELREPALKGVAPVGVDKRTGSSLLDPKQTVPTTPLNASFPSPQSGAVGTEMVARTIAQSWLDATMEQWSTIVDGRELPYGWGFSWNTDEYLRTKDLLYALGGNGPLIVLRATGALYALGTATSFEAQCAAFERNLLPVILR